ncbi:MAG: hypothetical protein ACK5LJ_17245 [Paracoccus sp. (in: a-proteobacteria)]
MSLIANFDEVYRDFNSYESSDDLLHWTIDIIKVTSVALLHSSAEGDAAKELNYAASGALEIAYALAMRTTEKIEGAAVTERCERRAEAAKQAAEDRA